MIGPQQVNPAGPENRFNMIAVLNPMPWTYMASAGAYDEKRR